MGNHLVGQAPAQIFPLEYYMAELTNLNLIQKLGSTRFLKVVWAAPTHDYIQIVEFASQGMPRLPAIVAASSVVVKIFVLQDLALNLKSERERLEKIRSVLEGCINCLPFQKVFLTERAAFIQRMYVKTSLYDRMSTRPFLTHVEKKWIAFQLLVAIQQAHKHEICHGDIKMENVVITSWNWVLLTDFASFKPTFLPIDNPAVFSYFFDTSRRRTCCIAPERFKKTESASEPRDTTSNVLSASSSQIIPDPSSSVEETLPDNDFSSAKLKPSMDIFSAGCVLIELFTDTPVFSFSNLLGYGVGEYDPREAIEAKIDDPSICSLLLHMIQRDPEARNSASEYLNRAKGTAFPEYFYLFLQSYMQIFSVEPVISADNKVSRIRENIDSIVQMLNNVPGFDAHALTLIVTLLTSNVRSLKFSGAKLEAMEALNIIAQHVTNDTLLDRIVPFIIPFLSDTSSEVRIAGLSCLLHCLSCVSELPVSDANIFPEYIFPHLLPLVHDKNERVRANLARNIAKVAKEAQRFLDLALPPKDGAKLKLASTSTYILPASNVLHASELGALRDAIGQAVCVLLEDNVNSVKQEIMKHSVEELAVFFGEAKAYDILFSHMITFLNDKEDPQLRYSFYDSIVGLVAFTGNACSPMLKPLLQQGLSDSEEFVIARCINTMAELNDQNLLWKMDISELTRETLPYFLHPNLWIRQATAGLLASLARSLNEVDVRVLLYYQVQPYMTDEVVVFNKPHLVLSYAKPPIPRRIIEGLLQSSPDTVQIFKYLEGKKNTVDSSMKFSSAELTVSQKSLLRRLVADGMSESVEKQLLLMKDNLIKISHQMQLSSRGNMKMASQETFNLRTNITVEEGTVNLSSLGCLLRCEPLTLDALEDNKAGPGPVNEEWQHMFGAEAPVQGEEPAVEDTVSNSKATKEGSENFNRDSSIMNARKTHKLTANAKDNNQDAYTFAPCKIELDALLETRRREHALATRKQMLMAYGAVDHNSPPMDWKPKGNLLAHLHEHVGGIRKLVRIPEKPYFASAAEDGCVRLWDMNRMEGPGLINKAARIYNSHNGSPLTCLNSVSNRGGDILLASGAYNGSVAVLSLETGGKIFSKSVNVDEYGPPMEVCFLETGSTPIFGNLIGQDLRSPREAFSFTNGVRNGIQTAMDVSSDQSFAVCGTSEGRVFSWDLRFHLRNVDLTHPSETRIRCIKVATFQGANVWIAPQGYNEVGLWNLESQCRTFALWSSSKPLLSNPPPDAHYTVTTMCQINGNQVHALLTAGTDSRIRIWNLERPSESGFISGSGGERINPSNLLYQSKMVDGVNVVYEGYIKPQQPQQQAMAPASSPAKAMAMLDKQQLQLPPQNKAMMAAPSLDPPAKGHHDWITSLCLCNTNSSWYVISGAKDGAIKVWM